MTAQARQAESLTFRLKLEHLNEKAFVNQIVIPAKAGAGIQSPADNLRVHNQRQHQTARLPIMR